MKLLLPIGLIALISLVALIVIYLLRPNYQNKMISSTFVWKLSLKYKKKRIPISKLRNILILLCQIFILSIAAFIISKPVTIIEKQKKDAETIIVIDASSSMLAKNDGSTRFERAKTKIKELSDEVFEKNGVVSLIYAGPEASETVTREKNKAKFDETLENLECSYGNADVEGSLNIAETFLDKNPDAEVVYFTGTEYSAVQDSVRVVNVSEEDEWNAAVLDVRAEIVDGVYELQVDIASYGRNCDLQLIVEVENINGTENTLLLPEPKSGSINCVGDKTYTVIYSFTERKLGENSVLVNLSDLFNKQKNDKVTSNKFWSFGRISARIEVPDDAIDKDNYIDVYGGDKPKINIEYKSTNWNEFFRQALFSVGETLGSEKNLNITTINKGNDDEAETSGYDIYFFEHKMPEVLPKDGVVFMIDPDLSLDAGFNILRRENIRYDGDGSSLAIGDKHPITDGIDVTDIKLTEYIVVDRNSLDGYDVLMYYEGSPVVFVKNTPDTKIFVMAFDIHKSNIGISWRFPQLIYQSLSYFLPQTFDKPTYEVYEEITLNARGSELTVISPNKERFVVNSFPSELKADKPGAYTVEQKLMGAKNETPRYQTEKFFVRIPSLQSNIKRVDNTVIGTSVTKVIEKDYNELLIYFAAALFALAFIEWWLQSKSGV